VGSIRERARKLNSLPNAGVRVEDPPRPDLREFFVGNYRVIYRVDETAVYILMVVHGSKLIGDELP
jgi:plasmid stabilization system protein ParE